VYLLSSGCLAAKLDPISIRCCVCYLLPFALLYLLLLPLLLEFAQAHRVDVHLYLAVPLPQELVYCLVLLRRDHSLHIMREQLLERQLYKLLPCNRSFQQPRLRAQRLPHWLHVTLLLRPLCADVCILQVLQQRAGLQLIHACAEAVLHYKAVGAFEAELDPSLGVLLQVRTGQQARPTPTAADADNGTNTGTGRARRRQA
jgi:hypothetical protein